MTGSVHALLGEPFRRERAVAELIRRLTAERTLGRRELEGAEAGPATLREALLAPLLFEVGCLVRVRRAEQLPEPKSLVTLLTKGLPAQVYLVLEANKLDKRGALYRWVKAHGKLQEFEPPKRNALPGLVKRLLQERGVSLSPAVLQFLLGVVPLDLMAIAHEVDKLALYARGAPLDLEAVQGLLFGGGRANVFAFLDALGEREPQALVLLQRLLEAGEEPGKLFYLLANHVRALLRVKSLLEEGLSPREIAPRAGMPPWLVQRRLAQVHHWSQDELIEALQRLHEEDVRFKRGEGEPAVALLALALEWTGLGVPA